MFANSYKRESERVSKLNRILFICHGNICRSTMAQFVFADLVHRAGREGEFVIDSAATSREEIGNPPHYGTVQKLKEVAVPVLPHRARQITRAEYASWDYIVYMDTENRRGLMRILGGDPENKCVRLLDIAGIDRDVADPWYTGDFDATYRDVLAGCTTLLERFS